MKRGTCQKETLKKDREWKRKGKGTKANGKGKGRQGEGTGKGKENEKGGKKLNLIM